MARSPLLWFCWGGGVNLAMGTIDHDGKKPRHREWCPNTAQSRCHVRCLPPLTRAPAETRAGVAAALDAADLLDGLDDADVETLVTSMLCLQVDGGRDWTLRREGCDINSLTSVGVGVGATSCDSRNSRGGHSHVGGNTGGGEGKEGNEDDANQDFVPFFTTRGS